MSLSAEDRRRLTELASARTPMGWIGIQYLAALYIEFGSHPALEVTQVIDEATRRPVVGTLATMASWVNMYANFAGFIANSDTNGFRAEVRDPAPWNPQTGHFFSFVAWALNGVSMAEFQLAVGHEFSPDTDGELRQVLAGEFRNRHIDFARIVLALPLDTAGTINYANLDSEFRSLGWDSLMVPFTCSQEYLADPATRTERMQAHYTGNSIQDLRCTTAGLHLGRMIGRGLFSTALDVVPWLERNIMSCPRRMLSPSPPDVSVAGSSAA